MAYLQRQFDFFVQDFVGDDLMLGLSDVGDEATKVFVAPEIIAIHIVVTEDVTTPSFACW